MLRGKLIMYFVTVIWPKDIHVLYVQSSIKFSLCYFFHVLVFGGLKSILDLSSTDRKK